MKYMLTQWSTYMNGAGEVSEMVVNRYEERV